MHAARLGPDFRIGLAEQRIVDGEVDPRRCARLLIAAEAEAGAEIEFLRLPRPETFFDLIAVLRRVT